MATLAMYHGDGEVTELVKLEYTEITTAIQLEKSEFQHHFKGRDN